MQINEYERIQRIGCDVHRSERNGDLCYKGIAWSISYEGSRMRRELTLSFDTCFEGLRLALVRRVGFEKRRMGERRYLYAAEEKKKIMVRGTQEKAGDF